MSERDLSIERVLPASPEAVFAAWSDAESLATWMCPGNVERATVESDFRVGGRFRIVMHGTEQDFHHHGEYRVIEPARRLVFTWVSEWMPEAERKTEVSVTFEAAGRDATRVRLHHYALPESESYAGHAQGWAEILTKLSGRIA